jgi:hypothetical protein
VDPLSALQHPDGGAVGADQPRGHTVGYHEPISGCTSGIGGTWRRSAMITHNVHCIHQRRAPSYSRDVKSEKRESSFVQRLQISSGVSSTPSTNLAMWVKA